LAIASVVGAPNATPGPTRSVTGVWPERPPAIRPGKGGVRAAATMALVLAYIPLEAASPPEPGLPPSPAEAAATPTLQPESIEERWGLSIFVDQDSVYPWIAPWGGDQNYTMGVGLQISGQLARFASWPTEKIDWLFGLSRLHSHLRETGAILVDGTPRSPESHTLLLENGAFTPKHIEAAEPIFDDRPYASILALTAGHSTIDFYRRRVLRTDLTLGMLGLRLSESIQTSIHRCRRKKNQDKDPAAVTPYDPMGWPNQISDGGELTAKYTVTWLQALSESPPHDLTLHLEGSLGYYTNAAVGFAARLGWLRSDFWATRYNPLSYVNQAVPQAVVESAQPTAAQAAAARRVPRRERGRSRVEAYLFAAARARLVIYNELLQGGFLDSTVTIAGSDVERVVPEFDVGASLAKSGWTLTIAATRRSPEMGVGVPRTHTWGGIYVSYQSQ
jgi:hypothetical protein